jgi:hypothetical protein
LSGYLIKHHQLGPLGKGNLSPNGPNWLGCIFSPDDGSRASFWNIYRWRKCWLICISLMMHRWRKCPLICISLMTHRWRKCPLICISLMTHLRRKPLDLSYMGCDFINCYIYILYHISNFTRKNPKKTLF